LVSDGIQDASEPGVSGVVVSLKNNLGKIVATTITDANGYYLFTEVVPATYSIQFNAPLGSVFTSTNGAINDPTNSDANINTGITPTFTVNGGDNLTYIDAGIILQNMYKASLGDFVWNDLNQNGIQDAGEPGIPNVTVNLLNAAGTSILSTTTTDAFGNYGFSGLDSIGYVLEFLTPAGFTRTLQHSFGSATANNSDANATTGRTNVVTLIAGERNPTIDAGFYESFPLGNLKLGDKVWLDDNKNGIQDANEIGVPAVTVNLYQNGVDGIAGSNDDVLIASTVTNLTGHYIFANLDASYSIETNYNVEFKNLPINTSFTTPLQTANGGTSANDSDPNVTNGRTGSINLTANNLTIDAGLIKGIPAGFGSLGDKVFVDLNNDGIQNTNEPGVINVVTNLYKDANNDGTIAGAELTPIKTTSTNGLGNYIFTGLSAGTYQVSFSNLPIGYTLSAKDQGTNDLLDSDGNPINVSANGNPATTGMSFSPLYNLAQGEDNLSVDLGIVPPANTNTIGDFVWFDANNDGLQSASEMGVKGVMVSLLTPNGSFIKSTTTNENGNYLFTGLADGSYRVSFSNLPDGFTFTTTSLTNTTNGSDANTFNGKTTTVTVGASNRNDYTLDAGLVSTKAGLGNYVWIDANKDGIQDANELPVSGATVTLYRPGFGLDAIAGNTDDANAVASAITDANGSYYFGNLEPGDYKVGFTTLPTGYIFTKQVSAGDNQNNTNSDADANTGLSNLITLSAQEFDMTIDAGITLRGTASVGDYVWVDSNRNGLQEATETGVPGVLAILYDANNVAISSAITNGYGKYLMTDVPFGSGYHVAFNANIAHFGNLGKPRWTDPNIGANGAGTGSSIESNLDSDPGNIAGSGFGKTGIFEVLEGDQIRNVDAGIYYPIQLSGNVWHDVNGMTDGFVNNTVNTVTPPAANIPTGIKAYLINSTTGLIEKVALVSATTGTYFIPEIKPNQSYFIILSNTPGSIGFAPPTVSLPNGWEVTGEKLGITAGNDGIVNGRLNIPATNKNVINANFGIRLKNGETVIP
jgi:SdrD B-like domain